MFRLITSAALLTMLVGSGNVAQAGGGCPEGYTPQDGICKPYYGPSYGPGYGYRDDDYRYRYHHRRGKPCPEGFTVQDGVVSPIEALTIASR